MKIKIKDIRPEGLDIDYDITIAEVGLSEDEYLYLVEPLHVKAHVQRVEDTVLIKGTVNSRYRSSCSRTLVALERNWSSEFFIDMEINKATEFIEPNEDIRQEAILALPVKVLCDAELKKDKEKVPQDTAEDELKEAMAEEQKTYQPFADLKLKEK